MHAHLIGFPGFVFGILILAMIPLYVATTAIVLRTGKPLITIPLPRIPAIFRRPASAAEPAPEPKPDTNILRIAEDPTEMPPGMPVEMRAQYLRARKYGPMFSTNPTETNTPPDAREMQSGTIGELPIPTDFDFDVPDTDDNGPHFAPMFSDIDFDSPHDAPAAAMANTPTSPVTDVAVPATDPDIESVTDYLRTTGHEFTLQDDIIISDGVAIAVHTDPDFWIADDAAWFATGKTRPSPIVALNAAAALHSVKPVLYLGATNIMDLDTHRATWQDAGITVVTDLNDIFKDKKRPAKREASV